uniref:AlNc14C208G8869 protein n=1 Tax=Albugo laibachii Nc14 TaxID=890382 RepID=F0WR61_9STRA|nr:AlNc14C208G8869 [Albugo laibachii Nc14]|eukprot:CCA23821.1 AlNc14C208G8869 [Albugo laibachii Nc14]
MEKAAPVFEEEMNRLRERIYEELQDAITNVQIINQNLAHLNEVGDDIVSITSIWVKFLRNTTN